MNFAIALTAFGLLFVLRKRSRTPWWLRAALGLIAGASLANTGLGAWAAARVTDVSGLIGRILNANGALIVGVVALIVSVIVVYDIAVDRKADKPAMIGLIVLPLLFLAAVGPLATAGSGLSDAIAQVASNSIGKLIGG
ncbi:hypothetical protein FHX42_002657 [Saccharopolyspora lacisalsi]|uniref:Uncharacterized protein n=1 Tax=Halosaccharopolyspora lacisalsi TaxID=1000566 RepID=A0A839DYL6_9PSEU|nr:hypothetical protein [Halosaccharopolyspora lacisalsi]MBA8825306.1 hypothetical protein [Halosaccharopolyspora lacisalsi]